mgnify:CR=1 FL=1
MENKLPKDPQKFEEFLQYIQGTCKTLDEAVQAVYGEEFDSDSLSEEQTTALDNEHLLCPQCGWWVEPSEMVEVSGEDVCSDCDDGDEEGED